MHSYYLADIPIAAVTDVLDDDETKARPAKSLILNGATCHAKRLIDFGEISSLIPLKMHCNLASEMPNNVVAS